MVVGEASIHNIMGGMESTGGVRLHNHKRKLKQRFDIIKKLGQGTYGKVQLGINKETGQEVAIKTIKKCKIETEADLIRIRREIQIMSSVQHPNIIHIYEVFENREKMVLVMEYAAGGELYDYLSERKVLTEHEARRIFRQIATAVFYCHKHKICHRDLKLENILLDQVGNAKIADFGLSNVFDEQRLLNTFCGSPLYASPEIVKGTPYHGPEVDCWSLGVLLYTLVYGAMPFDGSNFKRLVKQISQSDYFEPKKPSPASPLIKYMLTVCPAKRADIERICTHWWVNEGYEQNCLDIAEELAAQTPVRLDLLLSLVPQSASAEKLVVGDQQAAGEVANNMSSETIVPTRCHSVGSLMELDQNSSDRRIRELLDEEPRASSGGDAKRKLETTPSMDETAAAGAKRKERSRRRDRPDEKELRTYKSASRHHSAPIPNSITEEAMEVEPTVTVPTSKTVDLNKVESTAACLELIEESKERSPSKERSKTPVIVAQEQPMSDGSVQNLDEKYDIGGENDNHGDYAHDECTKSLNSLNDGPSLENVKTVNKLTNEATPDCQQSVATSNTELSNETVVNNKLVNELSASEDAINLEATQREFKKLKEKALSLDSELSSESRDVPAKTFERRRSKIFETAEKFNQMASNVETEKPKKIFIPGVNVGGAKRVFERKASLSSITTPPPAKPSASKIIIDVPTDKKAEKPAEKSKQTQETQNDEEKKKEEAKKRAVDIITGAIGKPPVQRKVSGSPPVSPASQEPKKLPLKIPVGANDLRSASVSVSTPVETKFPFDGSTDTNNQSTSSAPEVSREEEPHPDEPRLSSKMEITLKSATLPRPRKTSKAEISLSGIKSSEPAAAFKSEVEAKIDAFQPQKLRTQRSEIAFPVAAAVPHANRSSSLEPETRPKNVLPKERIIPIQVEGDNLQAQHSSTPPPKPPMPQRSGSQRSGSLSRQSTADSDTDSALGSTVGPEPIRKSPREYIIPIAVEGGGYVTPRSGSVEPESKTSTPTSTNAPRSRFSRPRRMSSLLSDASEDESPFSSLHRDSEDLLQRHMHRLRSSRPSRQPPEHADSLSSGEDDDDDGFELLTAENLFSTLLSRVRSLTQRLNVDDNRSTGFPSSRLFGRLGSNSSQAFWGLNKPLSRRLTESQFRHSLSREGDVFSRKDSANSSNPGTPNSPGSHGNQSRESVFDIGSNTLPRDKIEREDVEAEPMLVRKEAQESLEQSFTPSLARRLSRTLADQVRQSRSPSVCLEKRYGSASKEALDLTDGRGRSASSSYVSDQTEYRERSADRAVRRSNSLLEPATRDRSRGSPRRSVSLFDDREDGDESIEQDGSLPPYPRQIMTLGRKYKEAPGKSIAGKLRRENFHSYRAEKIQEETDDAWKGEDNADTVSECTSTSVGTSNTNLLDATSSVSTKSYETSPTESSSNIADYKIAYKSDASKNFENRLLAAENLIKESKLKNLGPSKFNPNLSSSYNDTDKCDKQSLISIADASAPLVTAKRRSCIPSLRLRSGSLTRECSSFAGDRRKSFADSQDCGAVGVRAVTPEKSLLSKLFRSESKGDSKEKSKQHRISRFLRPDFFDTPREESQYVKEKEAQKAAENERRKSRFIKRKTENKTQDEGGVEEEKQDKQLKNEMNLLKKDRKSEEPLEETKKKEQSEDAQESKIERQASKSSFLQCLEKKLEKLRSNEESTSKPVRNGTIPSNRETEEHREHSTPPTEHPSDEHGAIKKAASVEDLTVKKAATNPTKNRVSSVLGLFKNSDAKQQAGNGGRSQILSKLKKSPPKMSPKGDTVSSEDVHSTSRIPTKRTKSDPKLTKKSGETKNSTEKSMSESPKRSPPKEKPKLEKASSLKERRASSEKESKRSPEKTPPKEEPPRKEEQAIDCGKMNGERLDKKLLKTKKNRSLVESGTAVSTGETTKREDSEKKTKKVITKPKENSENADADGAKKKKIVKVVKKVVKKSSDSSDGKSEEKGKTTKVQLKKKPVASSEKNDKSKEAGGNVDSTIGKSSVRSSYEEAKVLSKGEPSKGAEQNANGKTVNAATVNSSSNTTAVKTPDPERSEEKKVTGLETKDSKNGQARVQEAQRADRSNLKLDLSKIPQQHSFRNSTPKKDSPKSAESPKGSLDSPKGARKEDVPEKLMECLSKMTHRANITGNKIIIEKPLRAKDVAELKREVTECARIIESCAPSRNDPSPVLPAPVEDSASVPEKEQAEAAPRSEVTTIPMDRRSSTMENLKEEEESPVDYSNEPFSPMDEPESFDSWSVSSAELNHARPDLHSPTSPSHSLFAKSDNAESVIDRIRRRSFYSRFNDRRRPSLTAPPPGLTLPTSSTLPRKFSFNGHRDRSKYGTSSYGLSKTGRHGDRSYSVYGDDGIGLSRNRSLDRGRYSDASSSSPYIADLKSPTDHHLPSLSSSYDPFRRYLRSPTFDLSTSRSRYHSADFSVEGDLGNYRTPLSSLLNDTTTETSSILPRKYGTTVSEPKTIEYYEELLAPSTVDPLPVRRSPISNEYFSKCENGYYNGNLDLHATGTSRKPYTDSVASVDLAELTEQDDGNSKEQKRNKSEKKHLLSASTDNATACAADYS